MLRTSDFFLVRLAIVLAAACQLAAVSSLLADDDAKQADGKAASTDTAEAPRLELSDEVRDSLLPLFEFIAKADVSRVTIELAAESMMNGAVIDSQKSTYQIASIQPNLFTIYLKEPDQRTRIYCDGKSMVTVLAPDAYLRKV